MDPALRPREVVQAIVSNPMQPLACNILLHKNYPIVGDFSCGSGEAKNIPMFADIEAGNNLVHSDVLQRGWTEKVFHGPQLSIRASNGEIVKTRTRAKLLIK